MRVPLPGQEANNPRASGEFARPAPRPDWVAGEAAPSSASSAFPLKKKTRLCLGCSNVVSQSFTVCPRCGTPLSTYRHLETQKEGDVIVVRFVDHKLRDELMIGEIAEELFSVAERVRQQHLVLDFSGVVGLSSTMLGKLIVLQTKMKKQGGDLKLCTVGPEVRAILTTMHLDRTLNVEA
jgi:anti-anti-sigma factor